MQFYRFTPVLVC